MKDTAKSGWSVVPLATACESVSTGPFGSLLGKKDYVEDGVPLVNPIDIVGGKIQSVSIKRVSAGTSERLRSYKMRPDDIVVARRGELGRCARVTEENDGWMCGTGSFFIRPGKLISAEFLSIYISSPAAIAFFGAASTGATMPNISNKTLSSLPIPLPPLEEQHRIVAVLDEAFEGLARARAHAEANLQNARELFENSLEAELEAVGNSHETSLGEHIDLLAGFAFKSKGYTEDQCAMRLMRGDNIIPGAVRWQSAKYWPIDDCEAYEKFQLRADDVLIAMDRTWIKAGIKYAVLTDADVPSLLVQRVARLRCLPSLDTHFLAMLIGSKSFERYVLSIQTGTGVPHISPTQIKDFKFPLPDIETQAEMVERLLIVKNGSNELSESYSQKVQDIDGLRQSLLQKAFAGELT